MTNPLSESALRVREALRVKGIETPMVQGFTKDPLNTECAQQAVRSFLASFGLDMDHPEFLATPKRIVRMCQEEFFTGLDYKNFPAITFSHAQLGDDSFVCSEGMEIMSHCAHHLVTMDSRAQVAYIPSKKFLGLSKINRVCRFFASRPQLQELLTAQCLVALQTLLETETVAVQITSEHFCVQSRGVRDHGTMTRTLQWGGRFRTEPWLQQAFFQSRASATH